MDLPPALAGRAEPLGEGVTLLHAPPRFPFANALLLEGGGERVLVDAGLEREVVEALASRVDRLLVTHFHYDHVRAWKAFEPERVWMNADEAALMRDPAAAARGLAGPTAPEETLRRFFESFDFPHGEPGNTWTPRGTLDVAGRRFTLVPAPGHSPAHVLLHDPSDGLLFSVDVEFSPFGPWYGWDHCDATAFGASVRDALPLFRDARVVATSHSPPLRGGAEAAARAFLAHLDARDAAVLDALAQGPLALDDLVDRTRIFYGKFVPDRGIAPEDGWRWVIRHATRVMTRLHLERLAERNAVAWDGETARRLEPSPNAPSVERED